MSRRRGLCRSCFQLPTGPPLAGAPSTSVLLRASPRVYEGGIAGTRFGADLYEADYRLKLLALGNIPTAVQGFQSYFDLVRQPAVRGSGLEPPAVRFWFYPTLPTVVMREGVVSVEGLRVQVLTEALDSQFTAPRYYAPSDMALEFSFAVNSFYEELSKEHRALARLPGLAELIGLAKALEDYGPSLRDSLDFWLTLYPVGKVSTPIEVPVAKRNDGFFGLAGGVMLSALVLRLESGDVSALREAVISTRPGRDDLTWSFSVGRWVIPISAHSNLNKTTLAELYAQAVYLIRLGYLSDAKNLLDLIDTSWPGLQDVARARKLLRR